ncbi:MAG: ABC transporter permease subunit [Treponema sp.]|jgi:putative aldouronate transport system permease protein|nr:ABC transporter permease subunit [Treponema sp.]
MADIAPQQQPLKKQKWKRDDTQLLILSLPGLLHLFIFWFMPIFGIIVAFKTFRVFPGSNFTGNLLRSAWAGLDNFKILFSRPDLPGIVGRTVLYNIFFLACGMIFPVGLALIISELRQRFAAKVYQTIMFLPNFLSWVIVAALVWSFLSMQLGIVNQAREYLGYEAVNFYANVTFWPPFLVLLAQWKGVGFGSVVYLAAITSLDKSVYDAAIIDGATKRQQIWYITLPLIKRIIILMLIMSIGGLLGSDFGLFYVVTRETPSLFPVTMTTSVLLYQMLKDVPIGVSSAAGLVFSVLGTALVLTANAIVRKVDRESAMI